MIEVRFLENGKYAVCSNGVIQKRDKEGIQRPIPTHNSKGYRRLYMNLPSINPDKKCQYVHQVVALTYIPNPDNLPMINHKDEDKTNNNVQNLEQCDAQYNLTYGTRISKYVRPVYCIELGREQDSLSDCARELGIDVGHIQQVCAGKLKTYKKKHFIYLERN